MTSPIVKTALFFGANVAITFALASLPNLALAVDWSQSLTMVKAQTVSAGTSSRFVAAPASAPKPFWQFAIYGQDVGGSNILVNPVSGGGAPEIIIDGRSGGGSGGGNFWQVIRYNVVTKNYDQLFVSPIYTLYDPYFSPGVRRIEIGNVIGDSSKEIVVMVDNGPYAEGEIYIYDLTTKEELGKIETGLSSLEGLCLTDLDGDGLSELIVATAYKLSVFSGAGNLLWQVSDVGGYDVVAGQMDTDPAIEIAMTDGKVVDAATHAIQWTYNDGFGSHLRLAPLPGKTYQQLIAAEDWNYVYAYDVANKLRRWTITTPHDTAAIQVADVDNDGVPEVLIGDRQYSDVHVYDLVTQAEKWTIQNQQTGVTNIAVADVDADGVVDLLWGIGAYSSAPDYFCVANTTGDHSIKWQSTDLEGPFLGPEIGDLDGDGKPELVVCSSKSEGTYNTGRILVFDLATLKLRGISAPVADNQGGGLGVRDLKLRDVDGDSRMEIVIGTDYSYEAMAEIYSFDSSNTFKRIWTNPTRPEDGPFEFVEVADLDGNGTRQVIGATEGNTICIYDYPSGTNLWTWPGMPYGYSGGGLVVKDLDASGNKKIAVLFAGDLYTFDGPSRKLESLVQGTSFTSLTAESTSYRLIAGDDNGVGHFLEYASLGYNETLARQLVDGAITGIHSMPDGELWTGSGNVVNLRLPSAYDAVTWQTPALGATTAGRFVATQVRGGRKCVFTSTANAVMGFDYGPQPPPGQLKNISTRLQVLTGDNVMIGGFTVSGSVTKKVLLRALGPTLTQFGVGGALINPTLELHDGTGALIGSNDNWKDTQEAAINNTGLAPPNDLESAILRPLAPGNYTAIVRGQNNTTGIGLIEVYDADQGTAATVTNISTRGFVAGGQGVMIGGFISGNGLVKLIVRALGPTLSQFNVPNPLSDPMLELHDADGTLLASNDNWADSQEAAIQASGYAPPNNQESAIVVTRPSTNTTAIVRGKNNTSGNALVEVYALPQ